MKRIVRVPYWRARSASAMTCLISLIPESTAENSMNSARLMAAMILASVVCPFPVPPEEDRASVVTFHLQAERPAWGEAGAPGRRIRRVYEGGMRSASGRCAACWASEGGMG